MILKLANEDAKNSEDDDLFIEGKVHGVDIDWLVDTGCPITIISREVYQRIPESVRPQLEPYKGNLYVGEGSKLDASGWVDMPIEIGPLHVTYRVVVANITTEGFLGLRLLRDAEGELDLKRGYLNIGGIEIKAHRESRGNNCHRVSVMNRVTIPAGSRMIVKGEVNTRLTRGEWMTEPLASFVQDKSVLVARTLVKGGGRQVAIELMNPLEEDVILNKGTHLAVANKVQIVGDTEPIRLENDIVNVRRVCTQSVELPEELQTLSDSVDVHMSPKEQLSFRSLLNDNRQAFRMKGDPLGRTSLVQHEIKTTTEVPVKQPSRRFPLHLRQEGDKLVQDMIDQDLIEPSESPWASPVVLVKKKDGSLRFCVDYRRLNSITVKDVYPIPRIDENLDALNGSRYFSTLDLASGYWQVPLSEDARQKSAFVVSSGFYQFKVLPMGLSNSGSTFERLMERVLRGLQWRILLLYLDDIVVFSKTVEEHMDRLHEVLQRLIKAGLKLKPSKCKLFQRRVLYLGHIVSEDGIAADPEKVEAVQSWKNPKNVKDIRSFLGMCSYYRRFIKGFSTIAKPLTKLTEKNVEFEWGDEQQQAWEILKQKLVESPILAYPDPECEFILDTDASGYGIGAVLSQVQGGKERVVAYGSRTLTKAERSYCVTRRELLAVVFFIKYFQHYLYGKHFKVRTDHGPLVWYRNLKLELFDSQRVRWEAILSRFDFNIVHRAGLRHANADALSRLPLERCRQCKLGSDHEDVLMTDDDVLVEEVTVRVVTREQARLMNLDRNESAAKVDSRGDDAKVDDSGSEIRLNESNWMKDGDLQAANIKLEQAKDEMMSDLMSKVKSNDRGSWQDVSGLDAEAKSLWHQFKSLKVVDGLLCREFESSQSRVRCQVVIPRSLRRQALESVHDHSGHFGIRRTLALARSKFYWPGLRMSVELHCNTCCKCQAFKNPVPSKKPQAYLQTYKAGSVFQRVVIDITGPFHVSKAGNKYVLVVQDWFSKFVEAYPIPDMSAETVAKVLVMEWFSRYGAPNNIHSDQGRTFESQLFQQICHLIGSKKTRGCPYHPESQGLVERYNRTLGVMLGMNAEDNPHTWDERLSFITMAYRSTPHESTGLSPNFVVFGKELSTPVDVQIGLPDEPESNEAEYVKLLRQRLTEAHELVRDNLQKSCMIQKRQYDIKAYDKPYSRGDLVWTAHKLKKIGKSPKLQPKWIGPAVVMKRINDVTYRIRVDSHKDRVVHYNYLKPFVGRDTLPLWVQKLQIKLVDKHQETDGYAE